MSARTQWRGHHRVEWHLPASPQRHSPRPAEPAMVVFTRQFFEVRMMRGQTAGQRVSARRLRRLAPGNSSPLLA
jgi:hypothetical protein